MSPPFATASDLNAALARYDAEAARGAVHTGRYRLRYVVWGESDRPPLVFVHGLSDRARSFAMVMARLVDAGSRCVGYELPNGLDDGANLGMYKHPHLVADLIALLDHLGIDNADLIGSSFGTTVALRALATHPGRFRRGVLKGGFARRPLRWTERGLARLGRYWPWRLGQLPGYRQVMARLEGQGFSHCPPEVFRFLLACGGAAPARAVARRALMLDTLDLRPLLPAVPHPVLMIGGDRDGIVPRWCEEEVERGLKDVRRVELTPCGRYPQYTLPGATAEAITGFLA
ncbi:MAG TPA: alpha/beta hydrolase [Fimbriiglobus sp.]|nr:alpha/beta hydrolase [Fimbriiglobus sp.]